MIVHTQAIRFLLAAAVATTSSVMAQSGGNGYDNFNSGGLPRSQSDRDRVIDAEADRWNPPGTNSYRPASMAGSSDFPELPATLSRRTGLTQDLGGYSDFGLNGRSDDSRMQISRNERSLDWRTGDDRFPDQSRNDDWSDGVSRRNPDRGYADPFRRPANDWLNSGDNGSYPGDRTGRQTRYRVPLDRGFNNSRGLADDNWNRPAPNSWSPIDNHSYQTVPGRDPFVPSQIPAGRIDSDVEKINQLISARYQNPVNVRAVRAMSASQAANLFAEVSQKIDERHLQPSTYDLRVRRALRNLSLALDNATFTQSLGVSGDSFRTDSFRNTLSSLASSMRVSNYQDARTVMNTVMQQAQTVPGLSPSVVAFEFANASMDTLDKFSGIEPADPGMPRAGLESGTRSASLENEIVGVGVEVKENARGLLVVKALRDGPAAEAGFEPGDLIIAINGRSIEGMPMANSVDLMKGTAGSSMAVRIYRAGKGERNVTLTRRKVRVWTVNDTRLLQGTNVGYLSLSRFAQNSTAELDQALSELHTQGMKSLIIDLRGNPGGLLTTCVEISDRFLPCGTIVSTKGRLSSDNMVETANRSRTWSTPLVVLVDGDSASASEIFAAAVQENQRGVVVGTKSYGKGSVQTHFPLTAISGNLRLTTATFYSPSGREIAGEGVTPDVLVHDPDGVENGDQVLARAVQIATSSRLQEMARAAGTCRIGSPAAARSSSLENIDDALHLRTSIR